MMKKEMQNHEIGENNYRRCIQGRVDKIYITILGVSYPSSSEKKQRQGTTGTEDRARLAHVKREISVYGGPTRKGAGGRQ